MIPLTHIRVRKFPETVNEKNGGHVNIVNIHGVLLVEKQENYLSSFL